MFLSDRKIDMIISGGVNIYPAEIEGVLLAHPAVEDAAVFGIPNDDWGEEVKAAVELFVDVVASDELAFRAIQPASSTSGCFAIVIGKEQAGLSSGRRIPSRPPV